MIGQVTPVPRHYSISILCSSPDFARLATVKPADPQKCADLAHFSGFDWPLFWSVFF